jgi:glycosyltransferase involved in cell wall biosynthesis
MNSPKLWLLFLWRLEKEKGFDLIYEYLKRYNLKELPFDIYIFWTGSYEKKVLDLANCSSHIHFFWWKPLSEVERYLVNIDYCLMPSRFLETFWLSAINVLRRGIPVVWFKKW